MSELYIEKQAGIDEQQEECCGEQEGGYGQVYIELVDAGCPYGIDGCRAAGKDHERA